MDASTEMTTFTLRLPKADVRLLTALAKKMGWSKQKVSTKPAGGGCALDRAIAELRNGDLHTCDTIDDLSEYLHS